MTHPTELRAISGSRPAAAPTRLTIVKVKYENLRNVSHVEDVLRHITRGLKNGEGILFLNQACTRARIACVVDDMPLLLLFPTGRAVTMLRSLFENTVNWLLKREVAPGVREELDGLVKEGGAA